MTIPEKVLELLCFQAIYKEDLVKYIDDEGRMLPVPSFGVIRELRNVTIKIEGMERIFRSIFEQCKQLAKENDHDGPVTCHLFWAKPGAVSFPTHTDPYDVFLNVISGKKLMEIGGKKILLEDPNHIYRLKANTPHRAINIAESWMLSYGLDTFISER